MQFLDVDNDPNNINNYEILQNMIRDNQKNVFVLVYMDGCGPCKETLPEWHKIKKCSRIKHLKNNNSIVVANIERHMCQKMKDCPLAQISSFPTINHIKNNNYNSYNDDRTVDAFSEWISNSINDYNTNNHANDLSRINANHLFNQNANQKQNYGNIRLLLKDTKRKSSNSRSSSNSKKSKRRRRKNRLRFKLTKKQKQKQKQKTSNGKQFAKKRNKFQTKRKRNSMSRKSRNTNSSTRRRKMSISLPT